MKSTGIVRRLDDLGRIVIPKSIRQMLEINDRDALEIFTDENRIVLQKYVPDCIFCGCSDNVIYFCGKRVCESCIDKLKEQF